MSSAGQPTPPPSSPRTEQEDRIKRLPADAQAAFARFQSAHDPAELDPILFAILADFMPTDSPTPLAQLPGTTRLVDDLGFDSLAITELVFFTEDLFGISISNQEIIEVRSLDDLRGFICRKVAVRPAS
jgi:acyl carrier protein